MIGDTTQKPSMSSMHTLTAQSVMSLSAAKHWDGNLAS